MLATSAGAVLFVRILFSVFSDAVIFDPVAGNAEDCDVIFMFSFDWFIWFVKFPEWDKFEVLLVLTCSVWVLFEFGYAIDDADNADDEYLDEEFEPLRDASDFPEFPIENTEANYYKAII